MSNDLRTQIIAAIIMAVALVFSGTMATDVAASTGRNHLTYMDTAEEGDPPQVALGIAMGAFRGLFVNMLWMRANDLKEEGKFYEAMELARAITRLQPRFNQVWVFHAWNMAYNISVTTQTTQERWQWVNNGINLLRRDGLRANPNDMLIHKELAWIFLHKIAGFTDDANQYYKRQLALEWTEVLGPPPFPTAQTMRDRDAAIQAYVDWLQPIVDAPSTIEQAITQQPKVADIIARLQAGGGAADRRLLAFYAFYQGVKDSGRGNLYRENTDERGRALLDVVEDPDLAEAWPVLLAHLRKRVLIDQYNMEPSRMVRYTQKYGPIDWRHPAAHALYWGARGVEQGLDRVTIDNRKDWDFVNADRIVIQAVQELYRSGELYFAYVEYRLGNPAMYDAVPNAHFFDTYGTIIYELASRSWAEGGAIGNRAYSFYAAGYENFLKDGVRFFYRRGQFAKAEEVLARYRTWDGRNLNISTEQRVAEDRLPLDQWVETQYTGQRWSSPYVAQAEVSGALQGAFAAMIAGDQDMFQRQFQFAADFHRKYFEVQPRFRTSATEDGARRMDQLEPDFRMLAGSAFARFMSAVPVDYAERAYDIAPPDLRRFAFDILVAKLKGQLDAERQARGRGFDEMFPEPSGMNEFRQWYTQEMQSRAERDRQVEQR
ncbi:MAG: hypothetical protein KDA05_03465 [Phycisphaerales bacterium]|nr:hypothetical protein [Phycisphaerales bacterium]MCB9841547.1 hypothetical protein [Phycisphaeraceae bacterium]